MNDHIVIQLKRLWALAVLIVHCPVNKPGIAAQNF